MVWLRGGLENLDAFSRLRTLMQIGQKDWISYF